MNDEPHESIVEGASLSWLGELGYAIGHGPHLDIPSLATLRDTLLPRLMSDKLRILDEENKILELTHG
ncbi:MAG: hypothetical protein Q8O37_15340 [Sulfuricellaceae bacterium]|nr:hypothetical protein [Sulfuricellaceae bacterium]